MIKKITYFIDILHDFSCGKKGDPVFTKSQKKMNASKYPY